MSNWQPIETAPKEEVILYYPPSGWLSEWVTIGYASGTPRRPTHWMPKPQPPRKQS